MKSLLELLNPASRAHAAKVREQRIAQIEKMGLQLVIRTRQFGKKEYELLRDGFFVAGPFSSTGEALAMAKRMIQS